MRSRFSDYMARRRGLEAQRRFNRRLGIVRRRTADRMANRIAREWRRRMVNYNLAQPDRLRGLAVGALGAHSTPSMYRGLRHINRLIDLGYEFGTQPEPLDGHPP